MLYLFTDGSSTGRANREWGWGWVMVKDDLEGTSDRAILTGYGGGDSGTNNVAELTAAINGLAHYEEYNCYDGKWLKPELPITLVSDSLYVLKIASGEYTPKKNLDLCKELRLLYLLTKAESLWIKGHSGNKWNDMADKLSKQGKALYAKNNNII